MLLWPIFLPRRMTVTQKHFKILSGHGFSIKCYCDLDLLILKFIGVIYWPWPIFLPRRMTVSHNFLRYRADTVFFLLNATVTLTFDLVTLKCVGVIYWVWPISLRSTMTITQKLFEILSVHGFCIKCYCDLDLLILKFIGVIYCPWPIFLAKYNDCHS